MAADYASTEKVRSIVYENLGVTDRLAESNYGSLDETNQRYPSGYIDDAIIQADITVLSTLLKSKQYNFDEDFFELVEIDDSNPVPLSATSDILSVHHYYEEDVESKHTRSNELSWEMWDMITENSPTAVGTSLFSYAGDTVGEGEEAVVGQYGGYYTVKDNLLYHKPFFETTESDLGVGYYKILDVDYPDTIDEELQSPKTFEGPIAMLASANLLMKRADQPEQAQWYMAQYQQMMQVYMTPSSNAQRVTDS